MNADWVGFAGAGVSLWAAGTADPELHALDGVEVVRRLAARGDRAGIEAIVAELIREVWLEWQTSRRPQSVMDFHLLRLPAILAQHRLEPGQVAAAITETERLRQRGARADLVAHRLVSDLILRARSEGRLDAHDLDETFCFFLLARLVAAVLERSDRLLALGRSLDGPQVAGTAPATDAPCGQIADAGITPANAGPLAAADTAPAAQSNALATALVTDIAEEFSVPVALLAAVIGGAPVSGQAGAPSRAEIEAHAASCVELLARLEGAIPEEGGPIDAVPAEALRAVRRALAAGRIDTADGLLAEGEAAAEGPSSAAGRSERTAMFWRLQRGALAEMAGDYRMAARHYAFAASRTAPGARSEKGPLLAKQAAALVNHGIRHDDEKALVEAAQVYAEAGGFLSEEHDPIVWAEAHADLGHLLLVLGERERRPERFLAAALHFKPAVDVFLRRHEHDRWAEAQVGLALSLKHTGEFQGDIVTLEDAAFAFRAALGHLTRDRALALWTEAQIGLGQTLVRIGEETGRQETLRDAVPVLRSILSHPGFRAGEKVLCAAEAALGRAYAGLGAAAEDETMLQEAISLLESALVAGSRVLDPASAAAIERVRGSALRTLGGVRGNVRLLEDGMRAKLAALGHYEQLGDASAVCRIREELSDVEEAIRQLDAKSRVRAPVALDAVS